MRINKYIAAAAGLSRRAADQAITEGRVSVNSRLPESGQQVSDSDEVRLDNRIITPAVKTTVIMLNKPPGYVCSREGQGSATVYELLPAEYQRLKPVGRLDKDSSGLLLLTDDGQLAQELTHPSYGKQKIYQVILNKSLQPGDEQSLAQGVAVESYTSQLAASQPNPERTAWTISMTSGRNRQIRRTFEALGYRVIGLHRTQFGPYTLGDMASGQFGLAKPST